MVDAKADIHKIIDIITTIFPFVVVLIRFANDFNTPLCSRPPTVINNPKKNKRVFQSIRVSKLPILLSTELIAQEIIVSMVAIIPIVAIEK